MFWVSCSQLGTKLYVFVVFLLQVFAEEANRDLQSSLGPQIDGECRRVTYKMKNKNKNKRYKQCYTENERVFKKTVSMIIQIEKQSIKWRREER